MVVASLIHQVNYKKPILQDDSVFYCYYYNMSNAMEATEPMQDQNMAQDSQPNGVPPQSEENTSQPKPSPEPPLVSPSEKQAMNAVADD
jgi:hypothetical protein